MTLARILAMSKKNPTPRQMSFVSPDMTASQRRETLDRTDFHSDPPAYPGTVDRRTSGIIFLGGQNRI